jgi:hypothetical protein
MAVVTSNINWGKNHWKGVLEADAKGYYAYLPAVFIYHDLNFNFFDSIEKEKYYDENLFYDYRIGASNGKIINKYYCGTALVQSPFFLIAHYLSYLFDYDTDGYSKLYPIFICIAALFYLLLGLLYLDSILKLYQITTKHRIVVLIAAVFGTNLFYYTIGEPGLSHTYSFTFISAFVYYTKLYFNSFQPRLIIVIGLILGVIILIRPINGLIIFIIPFLALNFGTLQQGFKELINSKIHFVIGFLACITIISIQLLYYKLATGEFFVYSYGEEGFNFLQPHIFDILFSFRKGLFLYTPTFLLSLTGLYFLGKSSKFEFYSIIAFLLLIIYVFSSWWMWYYGGSFSSRVFVEYISIFMILLAITFNQLKSKFLRKALFAVTFLFIVLCQIQTYQYRYYVIHWADMTKEMYWDSYRQIPRLIK